MVFPLGLLKVLTLKMIGLHTAIAMSKVVVDTYEGALSESGELINALKEGRIKKEHILSDLRELVLEEKNIRKDSNDITLFKSVGTALEDLAAAELVIE